MMVSGARPSFIVIPGRAEARTRNPYSAALGLWIPGSPAFALRASAVAPE